MACGYQFQGPPGVNEPNLVVPSETIAYFGPEGSFTHMVAQRRYSGRHLIPFKTIPELFEYLDATPDAKGVVPIENSSGGAIMPTIDGLIEREERIFIEEELSLDVKLALLGRKDRQFEVVYSHFAPLQHCEKWLKRHYPHAVALNAPSTSAAAQFAQQEENAAAIGPLQSAELHGLDVLYYPIEERVENVTQFFVLSQSHRAAPNSSKSSYIVALPNVAGSLFGFLGPFKDAAINLTRIQSRPIIGHPNSHLFFIEIEGVETEPRVIHAIEAARKGGARVSSLGSYPVMPRYPSDG